jgi:hypothetical protein
MSHELAKVKDAKERKGKYRKRLVPRQQIVNEG